MPPSKQMAQRSRSAERGAAPDGPATVRSRGMRDIGPDEMRLFRRIEGRFLESTAGHGFMEIRTPTIEPLHLFTSAETLSPQMLDRVYSFLDWDGWSGERVVLRPDSTVPAAHWHRSRGRAAEARLSYVQPVYRFTPDESAREVWQCGVELFGVAAPAGDAELVGLASAFLDSLGLDDLRIELGHAGLLRALIDAADLPPEHQLTMLDRLLDGDSQVEAELAIRAPHLTAALALLFDDEGGGTGYVANLRTAIEPHVPAAAGPLTELAAAVGAAGGFRTCRAQPTMAQGFEYYSGLTFRVFVGQVECLRGGRYDALSAALGDNTTTAAGFGADILTLVELLDEVDSR